MIIFELNNRLFMLRVCIVLVALSLFSCKNERSTPSYLVENEHIERYNFSDLEPLLHKNNDTTYIINFWATWCAPCVKELPYFKELHEWNKSEKLKVVLVSLDFKDKFESSLIPFIKKRELTPQVIFLDDPDENSWIPKVNETWSGALPATLIYNKDKRAFHMEPFTKETLFEEVEKFTKIIKS